MATTSYVFEGSRSAQHVFYQRTASTDFAFLVPHLKPGMRVADLGCGNGSITADIAALVAPGRVRGIDVSADAIARAHELAMERGLHNLDVGVGDLRETELDAESYDVVLISCVLGHLSDPAGTLALTYRALVPGGIIALRELHKRRDWFDGPYADSVTRLNELVIEDIRAMGGDPLVGGRLPELLAASGFGEISALPTVSPTLSPVPNARKLMSGRAREEGFIERVVARGSATREQLVCLADEIEAWGASPHALAAFSETTALARKER